MKVDRDAAERAAPFHHCCIEVRVRYTDNLQATERIDQRDRRRVQHRNAVPQNISIRCTNNQRALADGKGRLCPNADHSGLVLAVLIEMSSRQRRQRCPSLSAWRNVLPLFFANGALPRRDTARRILGAAGGANKRVHLTAPGTCALRHWLYAICHWLYAIPFPRSTPAV